MFVNFAAEKSTSEKIKTIDQLQLIKEITCSTLRKIMIKKEKK
jgi:hypothetical protein